jgi:hypothetical protein
MGLMLPGVAIAIPRRVDIVGQRAMQGQGVLLTRRRSRCGLWLRWWGGRRARRVAPWWRGATAAFICRVAAAPNSAIDAADIGGSVRVCVLGSTFEESWGVESSSLLLQRVANGKRSQRKSRVHRKWCNTDDTVSPPVSKPREAVTGFKNKKNLE